MVLCLEKELDRAQRVVSKSLMERGDKALSMKCLRGDLLIQKTWRCTLDSHFVFFFVVSWDALGT